MRDFDESQWTGCEGEFTLAKAEKELDAGELDSGNRAVIYGSDGTHRYYVKADGTMIFSSSHSSSPQATQKAEQLGFTIE